MDVATRGIFIVIDGIDGAGKTTQVKLLCEAFRSAREAVVCSKEPTAGQWGRKLRESATAGRMSLEDELRAFTEDRKEHVASVVRPALERGEIVILDRYYYSTIAYQGSRGADPKSVACDMHALFPMPDVAFLLDADPHVTLHRIANGRGDTPNEFERLEQLTAVRQVFLDLAAQEPKMQVINANRSIQDVYTEIARVLVDGVLKAKRCAKDYECDFHFCAPRLAGQCQWAEAAPTILAGTR